MWAELAQHRLGESPEPRLVQQADPEGRRVDRAVVEGWQGARHRRADGRDAHFVEDLAGLLFGGRVVDAALAPGQGAQRPRGQVGAERSRQPGRPQGVAAEEGQVPRRAGRRERVGRRVRVGQHQLGEVGEGVLHDEVEPPVGGPGADVAPVDEVPAGRGVEVGVGGAGDRHLGDPAGAAAGRHVGVPDERADAVVRDLGVGSGQLDPGLVAGVSPGEGVALGRDGKEALRAPAPLHAAQLCPVAGRLQPEPAAHGSVPARGDRELLAQTAVDQQAVAVHLDRGVGSLVAEVARHRHHPGGRAAAVGRDADGALAVGRERPTGQHPAVVHEQAGAGRVQVTRSVARRRSGCRGRRSRGRAATAGVPSSQAGPTPVVSSVRRRLGRLGRLLTSAVMRSTVHTVHI